MAKILIITTFVIMSGFCLNISGNNPLNGYSEEYSSSFSINFFNEVYAMSNWTTNSNFDATENEENLGKIIGQCYLDPLCFKLPIPENQSK